ncbi:MAG TPA: hypothetical protein VGF21_18495 [Thermoleophilaceae bacterium]|jgi:hypothetical protein
MAAHHNPAGVDLAGKLQLKPGIEFSLVFVKDAAELDEATTRLVHSASRGALTWVAYPKAGKLGTDLNRDIVRETLEPRGARTVRQISIDETWSALRLR